MSGGRLSTLTWKLDYYNPDGSFVARETLGPSTDSGLIYPRWKVPFWYKFKQFWLCKRNPDKNGYVIHAHNHNISFHYGGLTANRTFTFPKDKEHAN